MEQVTGLFRPPEQAKKAEVLSSTRLGIPDRRSCPGIPACVAGFHEQQKVLRSIRGHYKVLASFGRISKSYTVVQIASHHKMETRIIPEVLTTVF